jgi:hypothetical protein
MMIDTMEQADWMPRLRHEKLVVTSSVKNGIPKINEDRPLQTRKPISFHSKRQSMDQIVRMMKG